MCCLKYEQEAYEDAVRRMPKNESFVETPEGVGTVSQVNLLKETVKVRLEEQPEAPSVSTTARSAWSATARGNCPRAMCPSPGRAGQAAQDHPCGGAPPPVRQCRRRPQRLGRRPRRAGEARRGRGAPLPRPGPPGPGREQAVRRARRQKPAEGGQADSAPRQKQRGAAASAPAGKAAQSPPHHPRPPMGQRPFPPVRKAPPPPPLPGQAQGRQAPGPETGILTGMRRVGAVCARPFV